MNKKVFLIIICLLCVFVFWCESQENNDSNICTTWNECIDDLWDEVDQTYREVEDESDNNILEVNEVAPVAEILDEETIVSAWTRDD